MFGFLCGTSTMKRVSTDIFGDDQSRSCWSITKRNTLRFLGIIVTLAGMMISLALLLGGNGETTPCASCKVFSCVPFPPWVDYADKWWYCDDCGAVSADARIDPDTGKFDQLTIECPDGTDVVMDLVGETANEKSWLEQNLPTFCRQQCPNVHTF